MLWFTQTFTTSFMWPGCLGALSGLAHVTEVPDTDRRLSAMYSNKMSSMKGPSWNQTLSQTWPKSQLILHQSLCLYFPKGWGWGRKRCGLHTWLECKLWLGLPNASCLLPPGLIAHTSVQSEHNYIKAFLARYVLKADFPSKLSSKTIQCFWKHPFT